MDLNMFTFDNKGFCINGKRDFVLGGELHYFRVPREEWEDRILKIKAAGFSMISTYIPWIWHERAEGEIDLVGKTRGERDLEGFIHLVEKHEMMLCVRPGPYVMSELKHAGLPEWLLEKYGEIRATKLDGSKHPVFELVQFLHPVFLEKVRNWYQAVFEILSPHQISRGGCIIMVQLDNEIGMFHWVTATPDFSESVLRDFVSTRNEEVGSDKEKSIEEQMQQVKEKLIEEDGTVLNEYRYYERVYIQRYLLNLLRMGKEFGLEVPVIVNVHGFSQQDYAKRGNFYPIGLSQLKKCFKVEGVIAAGDYYIGNVVYDNVQDLYLANVITKSVQNPNQPLFSAEFQCGFQNSVPRLQPNTHDLNSRICIAQGMKAINFYMFAGGYNYEDLGIISKNHDWQAPISAKGELRKSYEFLKHLKKVIDTYGDAFLEAMPVVDTALFVDIDYFLTNYQNKENREMVDKIRSDVHYGLYNSLGKYLTYENLHVKGVSKEGLEEISCEEQESLIVFSTEYMDESAQRNLLRYLNGGGKVFLYPRLPKYNLMGESCTILMDGIGVESEAFHHKEMVVMNGCTDIGMYGGQRYTTSSDDWEVYGSSQNDKDLVLGFSKNIGQGQIVVLGGIVDTGYDYVRDGIRSALELLGIRGRIKTDEEIMVQCLKHGDSQSEFFMVHNLDDWKKEVNIIFDGKKCFQQSSIEINGREGLILPVNFKLAQDLTLLYATQELESITCTEDTVTCLFTMKTPKLELEYEGSYEVVGKTLPYVTLEDKTEIIFKRKSRV